jgi:hypothetical protein
MITGKAHPICKHIGESHELRSDQNLPKSIQSQPKVPPLRAVWDFPAHKKQNKFVLRIKVSAD